MGTLTEAQRKWLEGLGIDTAVSTAMPAKSMPSPEPSLEPAPAGDEAGESVMRKPRSFDPNSPEMRSILMQGILEQADKDEKEAEQKLGQINKALAGVKAYVAGIPDSEMKKASYATIMTEVRKRFPEVAGCAVGQGDLGQGAG